MSASLSGSGFSGSSSGSGWSLSASGLVPMGGGSGSDDEHTIVWDDDGVHDDGDSG